MYLKSNPIFTILRFASDIMAETREGLLYTEQNEWVRIEGNTATFGITDFSQNEMGELVYVELPAMDSQVRMGDEFGAMESVKSVEPLYAPVSGKIVKVNEKLSDDAKIANASPYDDGWIAVIEMSYPSEKEKLLSAEQYGKK